MTPEQIRSAFAHERRFPPPYADSLADVSEHVTRVRRSGTLNFVGSFGLDSTNVDQTVEREIEHYRTTGEGFEWTVYASDTPLDLLSRLEAAGFEVGTKEVVLVASPEAIRPPAECRTVLRVSDDTTLGDYRRVTEAAFGREFSFTCAELRREIERGGTGHVGFVAYDGSEPVSAGRLYTHPDSKFGGLFGGCTLPGHRGRGFYRAVTFARARFALELGVPYLVVDALPTSLPTLVKLGFVPIDETWPCVWRP